MLELLAPSSLTTCHRRDQADTRCLSSACAAHLTRFARFAAAIDGLATRLPSIEV